MHLLFIYDIVLMILIFYFINYRTNSIFAAVILVIKSPVYFIVHLSDQRHIVKSRRYKRIRPQDSIRICKKVYQRFQRQLLSL